MKVRSELVGYVCSIQLKVITKASGVDFEGISLRSYLLWQMEWSDWLVFGWSWMSLAGINQIISNLNHVCVVTDKLKKFCTLWKLSQSNRGKNDPNKQTKTSSHFYLLN